jgi:oligopeptide/dipeptide ABC transporter ATP-binding protein
MNDPLLQVQDLKIQFFTEDGVVRAVDGISFDIRSGEIMGMVGESGCGKSVSALSILRLLAPSAKVVSGEINFRGKNLIQASEREMQQVRGNQIAMIFQEPMTSLNPVMTVGDQVAESLILHKRMSHKEALTEAIRLFESVRIPDASNRVKDYPHQMSGGMRQRVMIAMAIACHPALLIADEPTTALDVTIQAQILELLNQLRSEYGLSILLITHALGVVAETADRVIVMYAGKIVEEAPVQEIFEHPCHPYTVGLLDSIPKIETDGTKRDRLKTIEGFVPDLMKLPAGCSFYDRCTDRMDHCSEAYPEIFWINPQHRVSCFKWKTS